MHNRIPGEPQRTVMTKRWYTTRLLPLHDFRTTCIIAWCVPGLPSPIQNDPGCYTSNPTPMGRSGVLDSTLTFGSMNSNPKTALSNHSESAFSKLRSIPKCSLGHPILLISTLITFSISAGHLKQSTGRVLAENVSLLFRIFRVWSVFGPRPVTQNGHPVQY